MKTLDDQKRISTVEGFRGYKGADGRLYDQIGKGFAFRGGVIMVESGTVLHKMLEAQAKRGYVKQVK